MVIKPIRAGDTYKVAFIAPYDSSSYEPKLILNNAVNRYEKVGSGDFLVEITAAETALFVPSEYAYSLVVFNSTERHTVHSGFVQVLPDIAAQNAQLKSNNKLILEAIEATIKGVATLGQQQTSINGKSISRYSPDELLKLHVYFRKLIKQEENALKYGSGNRKIMVRF